MSETLLLQSQTAKLALAVTKLVEAQTAFLEAQTKAFEVLSKSSASVSVSQPCAKRKAQNEDDHDFDISDSSDAATPPPKRHAARQKPSKSLTTASDAKNPSRKKIKDEDKTLLSQLFCLCLRNFALVETAGLMPFVPYQDAGDREMLIVVHVPVAVLMFHAAFSSESEDFASLFSRHKSSGSALSLWRELKMTGVCSAILDGLGHMSQMSTLQWNSEKLFMILNVQGLSATLGKSYSKFLHNNYHPNEVLVFTESDFARLCGADSPLISTRNALLPSESELQALLLREGVALLRETLSKNWRVDYSESRGENKVFAYQENAPPRSAFVSKANVKKIFEAGTLSTTLPRPLAYHRNTVGSLGALAAFATAIPGFPLSSAVMQRKSGSARLGVLFNDVFQNLKVQDHKQQTTLLLPTEDVLAIFWGVSVGEIVARWNNVFTGKEETHGLPTNGRNFRIATAMSNKNVLTTMQRHSRKKKQAIMLGEALDDGEDEAAAEAEEDKTVVGQRRNLAELVEASILHETRKQEMMKAKIEESAPSAPAPPPAAIEKHEDGFCKFEVL